MRDGFRKKKATKKKGSKTKQIVIKKREQNLI